jgi:cytochrome o ubiquinol oxidase operon protein cyoD
MSNNSEKAQIITHSTQKEHKATLKAYVTGFILSIVLTLVPYFLVSEHLLTGYTLITIIILLACGQLVVQMVYFLHMKEESKPRYNMVVLISFGSTIIIIVVASIWIMQHLNYNMSLMQMDRVMQRGEGF